MKRLNENEIIISQEEANDIYFFIRSSLDRQWDRHTDHYICNDSWEDGMRRMDPEMYDFAEQLNSLGE
jgi:hypothetical protein